MVFNSLEGYCPYRITRETFQDFSDFKIPKEEIPAEGICSISPDRRSPCICSGSWTKYCQRMNNNDFCDMSWAK